MNMIKKLIKISIRLTRNILRYLGISDKQFMEFALACQETANKI